MFNLCAVMSVGLYTASLILHVQVVGDFGEFGVPEPRHDRPIPRTPPTPPTPPRATPPTPTTDPIHQLTSSPSHHPTTPPPLHLASGSAPEGSTLPQDLVLPHSCCERRCPRCCGPGVSALLCLEEMLIVPAKDIKVRYGFIVVR